MFLVTDLLKKVNCSNKSVIIVHTVIYIMATVVLLHFFWETEKSYLILLTETIVFSFFYVIRLHYLRKYLSTF